ncbi:pentatricopeptide repeat-containing protein At4g21065-like [Nymphaea colorata]|uniref:pentatricopeptide repeat-containing protein At4g21065-like n=1 Tax=Nymphaea colorata TaxID=210225 RepID=UPI00129DBC05|nr:pentatricopeptide repeat-containing protein At4g21065-like [Nymphaea colorata]
MPKGFRLVKQKFTLRQIKEIHACLLATGKSSNKFQQTKILALYASSPLNTMAFAELVFCQMVKPDTFSINTMIKGYNLHFDPQKALQFYYQMRRRSMASDSFTIAFVLEAVTAALLIRNGKGMHGQMIKFGFETSIVLKTNLIQMYADCGSIDDGSKVFDEMPRKDLISWSTMMAAYARLGRVREALALLEDMKRKEITPNEYTMVPLLRACAQACALTLGEHLHAYIGRSPQIRRDTHLGNVLVYMYAACGALDKAVNVFNEIEQKDVLSWSTMIGGFAVHGHGEEALSLFAQMKFAGVKPNDATLVSVLQACSHAGLVSEGRKHFDLMKSEYGVSPKLEHYGCMVDMLGRAGLLPEAHEFINSMPIPPNAIIWRTLLGACNAHGDTKLAEMVSKTLQESDCDHVGNHVLMSNIYCKAGRWFDAERIRNMINPVTNKKLPGESSIEASSNVNAEIVNPPLHLKTEV